MKKYPKTRTLYILAAITVLLFAISFLFEEYADAQSPLLTFERPNQKIGGSG